MEKILKPYKGDIKLLRLLGLKEWEANQNVETFIGEVFPNAKEGGKSFSIKIYVTCLPAQFYKFIVKNDNENIHFEIETGSGSLGKFYPMALSIAEGSFVIKQVYS